MNEVEFRSFVVALTKRKRGSPGDLEEYLRSLWALIQDLGSPPITCEQLAALLEKAFSHPPAPFDPAWMKYTGPPENIPDDSDSFEILKHILWFQIADLRRMRGNVLDKLYRYFGEESPTGNRWYNFDPCTYLECGTALFGKEPEDDENPDEPLGWIDLAEILEMGRTYE